MAYHSRPITNSWQLVIQPCDAETFQHLSKLGFHLIPDISQLMYLTVQGSQLSEIFGQLSQELSEHSQIESRFALIHSDKVVAKKDFTQELLLQFLHARPLTTITTSVKYKWFFRILAEQSLLFRYQPIFHLNSGAILGHECLAYATEAQNQQLFTGQYLINAALATHSTLEFDELARELCIQAIARLGQDHTFFINLLPNAIVQNPRSLEQNFQQVIDLGLRPQRIVFELTELQMIQNPIELRQLIERLQSWGFGVAIDDLCSYVPNSHYCLQLHPDIIKLDRQLIHGCSQHPLQQILIKSLLTAAHDLGILVVAEGLEAIEDIQFCQELGVDFGQGFGLGLPAVTLQDPVSEPMSQVTPPLTPPEPTNRSTNSKSQFGVYPPSPLKALST